MERKFLLIAAFALSGTVNAQTFSYINANNIKARISCGNPWFFDATLSNASFEAPAGSGKHTIFASGLWMGGEDFNGALKLAGALYGQNGTDFQPGPVSDYSAYTTQTLQYDRIWKINQSDVITHINTYNQIGYTMPADIATWPAHGDTTIGQAFNLAPFIDTDGNGVYNPANGDYPSINGDVALFYIINDDKMHTETGGDPIRAEIHVMAYALNCVNDSALFNTVFINAKIINRSTQTLYNFKAGVFTDGDVGCSMDDYLGSDVARSMYYFHNGDGMDASCMGTQGYDSLIPYQGVVILGGLTRDEDALDNGIYSTTAQAITNGGTCYPLMGTGYNDGIIDNERFGLTNFQHFNNTPNNTGNPTTPNHYYNFMNSMWKDNTHLYFNGTGYFNDPDVIAAGNVECTHAFSGISDSLYWSTHGVIPATGVPWSEISSGNATGDRRGVGSSGSVTFQYGDIQELDLAYIFATNYQNPSDSANHLLLNTYTDSIHSYFKNNQSPCGSFIRVPLGISENKNNIQVAVYPNPVEYEFTITTASQEKMKYSICDISGNIITSGSFRQQTTVDVSALPAGLYVIHASNPQGVTVAYKIIKQ